MGRHTASSTTGRAMSSHGATWLVKNSPAPPSTPWKSCKFSVTRAKPSTPPSARLSTTIKINLGRAFLFSCRAASLLFFIVLPL